MQIQTGHGKPEGRQFQPGDQMRQAPPRNSVVVLRCWTRTADLVPDPSEGEEHSIVCVSFATGWQAVPFQIRRVKDENSSQGPAQQP
ncbi:MULTISPECIES: hypothetical protein [Brevibacterium]|uniref:hypothetical protein n=1 Tax=Brevibacterium TaxID=1696 RepID=UPI0015E097DA|nr:MULTISPECIES: hypothetical protein [Brevibacterium]